MAPTVLYQLIDPPPVAEPFELESLRYSVTLETDRVTSIGAAARPGPIPKFPANFKLPEVICFRDTLSIPPSKADVGKNERALPLIGIKTKV